MDRQNRWKAKPLPFGSQEAKLARADRHEARRRQQRTQHLERIRDIQPIDDEEEFVETLEDRSARLAKWKAERDLKKKLEAKNKRPAFKIGVPHHHFYSPTAGETRPHIHKKPKGPSPPKKISMVTQRRLAAKAAATGHSEKSQASHLRNRDGSQPSTSTVITPPQPRLTRSRKKAQENVAKKKVSLAPENYVFKIPSGVSSIPLFGDFIYPDAESVILDFNLNVNGKNNDIHEEDEFNGEESDKSVIETKESLTDQHLEPMTPQITSREKLTQQNSDKSTPIERSQSMEASDSSIESIEVRLSSQSELPQNDEDNLPKTEATPMLVESDELPTAALPEESHTSQNITSRIKPQLLNRNKPQLPTSSAETPPQPRITRSRRNAQNNVTTREISIALEDCVKASTGISSIPLSRASSSPNIRNPAISHCNVNEVGISIDSSGKDEVIDKSSILQCSESMPPQINSPEKLTQLNSDEPNQIESSQSIQEPDSSIESIVLRMSSQSESLQIDDDLENTETVPMNVDSDEPPRCFSPVPAQYSPFIVTNRGKSSARKEQKQRLSLRKTGSPYDDIPMKDTVLQNLNISVEEEERTAQYYKFLVQREENRLRDLCKVWEKIQGQPETHEDGHYMINQAIGQTNLLMRKKFERFRNLVLDCETGRGEQLVVCRDLQGFWAIVEREIRDCDSRFTKLEDLKAKDWKEEEEPEVTVVKQKPAVMKKKKKIAAKSNMRSFIEAARKKKLSQENAMDEDVPEEPNIEVKLVSKTPCSPHSRVKQTPRGDKTSLLKLAQLTESAKRRAHSSFAIVKVSQKCKTPEVQHDQSITYVNSDQTPGRGILKKAKDLPKTESKLNKSTCKVNFNDTIEMTEVSREIDEDENNRCSLAAALARIESLDFGHDDAGEEKIKANKKLEFEDDEADEYDDVFEDIVPSSTASEVPNDDFDQAVETTADGEHCEVRKKVQTPPSRAVLPRTESTSLEVPENETATGRINAIKSSKIAINVIQATPIDGASKNGECFRTEEAETLTNSCDRMPAPKLMKKGRSRRAQPVEEVTIEKRSTNGRKKSHGSMETDEYDVVQDTVPSSSKIPDGNLKQTVEAHGAENFELNEGFQTLPVIPVFMITVPTPSSETTISSQSLENNAVTKRRSKGKSRKSGTLKPNNVIINVTQAAPAGGVPNNGEIPRTDEVETADEPMPAPRLLRKCRNRRTESVETKNIENTSTRGRKKSLGNTTIEDAAIKKIPEDKVEDSEVSVRRQTRNRSVLTASAAGRNCNTLKNRNSQKKGSLEPEELRCCSDDVGDKENAITMDHQRPRTPSTPPNLIDFNYTPLRRSTRKSIKFIPENDCTACKTVPLTPRSMKVRMSFFGDDNPQIVSQPLPSGDLIAFDSPMSRTPNYNR